MRSLLFIVAFLGLCVVSQGEEKTKNVAQVGDICVLEAEATGKITWSVLWPSAVAKWQTPDGRYCVISTARTSTAEDPIRVQAIKWETQDVDIWSIVVGGVAPPPPDPDNPPNPPGPAPTTWARRVRARLATLTQADKMTAPAVAAAYTQAVGLIGTQAYTGPDCRAVIDEKVKSVAVTPAWVEFIKWVNIERANWEREKWRSWQSYQQWVKETAVGLGQASEIPLSYSVPAPLLESVRNSKPIVLGDNAFILDGQAYERRCVNGSCSYVRRGTASTIRWFDGRPYVVSQ